MKFKTYYLPFIITLVSCTSNRVFEDNYDFGEPYWPIDTIPEFKFEIKDQEVPYNIFVNIRNSFDYPYYNLYYKYNLKDSSGNTLNDKMVEIILFDAKTGKPLGDGLGDIFDHEQEILNRYTFPSVGNYTISLQQYMRTDSLPMILSVGARVEKSVN